MGQIEKSPGAWKGTQLACKETLPNTRAKESIQGPELGLHIPRRNDGCYIWPADYALSEWSYQHWANHVVRNSFTTACTQQTGSSLEKMLKGPSAMGTKGNGSRLHQQRPLQFHTRHCRAMCWPPHQSYTMGTLKATRVQVGNTAAPATNDPQEGVANHPFADSYWHSDRHGLCLFYQAVPHSPGITNAYLSSHFLYPFFLA